MTTCNYCGFLSKKQHARKKGLVIKKLPATWGMGGWEIFMVPKSIGIEEIRSWEQPSDKLPNGDANWEKYTYGWMMEIPDHCCC